MVTRDLAPVALFAYRRPEHTRAALEALARCDLSGSTRLYVYCDVPPEDANVEALRAAEAVRRVLAEEWPFGHCTFVYRDEHMGLAQSVVAGVSDTLRAHGRAIVLEDDLVVSRHFLRYMNTALDLYAADEHVFGISGYSFVESPRLPESYLLPVNSSWGWGTWSRAWESFDPDAVRLLRQIEIEGKLKDFDFGDYPYLRMLRSQIEGKVNSWAICFRASIFLQSGYFLFPARSLVANIGFDRSGSHGEPANPFKVDVDAVLGASVDPGCRPLSPDLDTIALVAKLMSKKMREQHRTRTRAWPLARLWRWASSHLYT